MSRGLAEDVKDCLKQMILDLLLSTEEALLKIQIVSNANIRTLIHACYAPARVPSTLHFKIKKNYLICIQHFLLPICAHHVFKVESSGHLEMQGNEQIIKLCKYWSHEDWLYFSQKCINHSIIYDQHFISLLLMHIFFKFKMQEIFS